MDARAITKAVQGSPQKARLVVDTIRGLRVPEALAILHYTNKRAAAMIEKTLRSAVANASNLAEEKNVSVDVDNLYVSAAMVDLGPTKHRRRRRQQHRPQAQPPGRHDGLAGVEPFGPALQAARAADDEPAAPAEPGAPPVVAEPGPGPGETPPPGLEDEPGAASGATA